MKRITLNLSPVLLVQDDTDVIALQQSVVEHILKYGVETVICRRSDVEDARSSFCEPGQHEFVVESQHTNSDPLPKVCRSHWYEGRMQAANDEHAPFFEALGEVSDLGGYIWQSGGMTMTIKVPLPDSATEGEQEGYPAYLGLKEGETEDGRWYGSVGYYPTWEGEDCVQVFEAYDEPLTPAQWAEKVAEHYRTLTPA